MHTAIWSMWCGALWKEHKRSVGSHALSPLRRQRPGDQAPLWPRLPMPSFFQASPCGPRLKCEFPLRGVGGKWESRIPGKGNDYTDCGHPCERDGLHLRDSNGKESSVDRVSVEVVGAQLPGQAPPSRWICHFSPSRFVCPAPCVFFCQRDPISSSGCYRMLKPLAAV